MSLKNYSTCVVTRYYPVSQKKESQKVPSGDETMHNWIIELKPKKKKSAQWDVNSLSCFITFCVWMYILTAHIELLFACQKKKKYAAKY